MRVDFCSQTHIEEIVLNYYKEEVFITWEHSSKDSGIMDEMRPGWDGTRGAPRA